MTNKTIDSQEDGSKNQNQPQPQPQPQSGPPGQPGPLPDPNSRSNNKVYKSGPLFLSSKGIGWTSWKKRWFILTRTSLVFFRSDPNASPQKGSEVNLTLGGIDLNSSGSVVVKADKKLLTVQFPDGRTFTLKAETLENLHEWKAALEDALSNAPTAATSVGQNILRNDQPEATDGCIEQAKDRQPVKSLVIGRPVLLALEDLDGTPSFLEKALRFVEEYGVKVEGILRQAADVDDVERRIREYEQGKDEFSPEEDPHVIADCVKYVLRELPSSPVPASCCNALLEAFRTDRGMRVSAMRTAICETFPEPNRRLLQRILIMMQSVASHKSVNRMSISAVAACMAPLLLHPLLSGDCELENDFDMGGDGSVQLLQAAAAANHAQAIVITLLEEYNNLFGERSMSSDLYTSSEESGTESEELSEDDENYDDDDYTDGSEADVDEDFEHASSGTYSETPATGDDASDDKHSHGSSSGTSPPGNSGNFENNETLLPDLSGTSVPQCGIRKGNDNFPSQNLDGSAFDVNEPDELLADDPSENSSTTDITENNEFACAWKPSIVSNGPTQTSRRPTIRRTPGKKNLSMESINISSDDEVETQRLEATKVELENKIAEETKENANLQDNLEKRKKALHERRVALEQDVARLQEQLLKERELRMLLENGINSSQITLIGSATIDEKIKADLEEISQAETDIIRLKSKVDDLGMQLNQQREQNYGYPPDLCDQPQQIPNHHEKLKENEKDETTATSQSNERSRSKNDTCVSNAESDKHIDKTPPQNQQTDSVRNFKSSGTPPTNPRKYGGKNEASSSTTSALTKLTNRLNFLKERRSQITNELNNIDKGRNPNQNADTNQEKCVAAAQGLPSQNTQSDKGKKSEGQVLPSLERGKSDSFPKVDEDRPSAPPRTLSR